MCYTDIERDNDNAKEGNEWVPRRGVVVLNTMSGRVLGVLLDTRIGIKKWQASDDEVQTKMQTVRTA